MKDFFISYNRSDRAWAEWIAWVLEEAGYSVVIQAWDFRPGENFILKMHRAAAETNKTIAVLSDSYLNALYTQAEWAAAFSSDPTGRQRQLIPVRVEPCKPVGLLASLIYIDIVGASEQDARLAILGAFSARAKPSRAPMFPGEGSDENRHPAVPFPGEQSNTTSGNLSDAIIASTGANQLGHAKLTPRLDSVPNASFSMNERLTLARNLSAIPPQQFNMIVFALNPPPGIIPPMPTPQGDRAHALLEWAKGPGGCSLHDVQTILNELLAPIAELHDRKPKPGASESGETLGEARAAEGAPDVGSLKPAGGATHVEGPSRSGNNGQLSFNSPVTFLREAVAAVPAVKYALGVGGVAAVIAIVAGFQLNFSVAVFGVVIMFGLMFVLLIFSKFTETASASFKPLSLVLAWTFVALTVVVSTLLVTSFFWDWPRPLDQYIRSHGGGPSPSPIPTPALGPTPCEYPNEWPSPFTSAKKLDDYWNYPKGAWSTEPGELSKIRKDDEALLVKGQQMGIPSDLGGCAFFDFRATFKIRFKQGGTRAAWVLRAQPDKASGYLFELVKEGDSMTLYFWIYEQGRKVGQSLGRQDIPFGELREAKAMFVRVLAKGNRFEHAIRFEDDAPDENSNAGHEVQADFRDTSPNPRWPWGSIGFLVTDETSVMRVESVYVYPVPKEQSPKEQ